MVDRLDEVGVKIERQNGTIFVSSTRRLNPVEMTTQPYPGFPTDLQAQLMALLCLGDGISVVTERIFPDRFLHVGELNRMGARIRKEGPTAIIQGVKELQGASVMASDLRASAALVLAGLVAKGTTRIDRVYHIDRGYEKDRAKTRRRWGRTLPGLRNGRAVNKIRNPKSGGKSETRNQKSESNPNDQNPKRKDTRHPVFVRILAIGIFSDF